MNKNKIDILYDGDCIYCNNFVRLFNLKKNYLVSLYNIRDGGLLVEKLKKEYDLNEGMVVIFNDEEIYFGYLALWFLVSHENNFLSLKFLFYPFRLKLISRFVYPFLKFGRKLTLMLRGKKDFK